MSKLSSMTMSLTFRALMLGATFALIAGCGEPAPSTVVSGKVTVNGDPVTGIIHFVGADGKETTGPVGPDGSYQVVNLPLGECTILVKPLPNLSAAPPITTPTNAPDMPGMPKMTKMAGPPPAKYSDASGGLKYTVIAGKQNHDIALTP